MFYGCKSLHSNISNSYTSNIDIITEMLYLISSLYLINNINKHFHKHITVLYLYIFKIENIKFYILLQ